MGIETKKFFDNSDSETDSSSCFYYKLGKFSNVFGWIDSSKSFYSKNRALRSKEFYSLGTNSGQSIFYHPNGKLQAKVNFKNAKIFGVVTEYFSNGKVKWQKLYNESTSRTDIGYVLINAWDSTGRQMIKNKEGYFKDEFEEGKIKNGLRDSTWKIYETAQEPLIEKYSFGMFIEGERRLNNQLIHYNNLSIGSEFEGGAAKLYGLINKNLRNPNSNQGKVSVEFIIEANGELSNFKIKKGINPKCDLEAIRVIRSTSPWIPAKIRGRPVRTSYRLEIKFE